MRLMPFTEVTAAKSMKAAATPIPDHGTGGAAWPSASSSKTELGATLSTDCLARVLTSLGAIINAVPVSLAQPRDRETWLCLDTAMSGRYGSLVALEAIEAIDRSRHPIGPTDAHVVAQRSDSDCRCIHERRE
jgi:hypothetical protein